MTRLYFNDMSKEMQDDVKKLNDIYFLANLGSWRDCKPTEKSALQNFNIKHNTKYTYFHSDFYNNFEKMFFEMA